MYIKTLFISHWLFIRDKFEWVLVEMTIVERLK